MSRAVEFTWAEETLGGVIFSETSPWIPDHCGFAACIYSEYVTFQIFSLPGHGGQEVSPFPSGIIVPLHMSEIVLFMVCKHKQCITTVYIQMK